jgi:hypothetical protein
MGSREHSLTPIEKDSEHHRFASDQIDPATRISEAGINRPFDPDQMRGSARRKASLAPTLL